MNHAPYYRALPANWMGGGDEPTRAECTCGWRAEVMPSLTVARQAFDAHAAENTTNTTPDCGGCGLCRRCALKELAQ